MTIKELFEKAENGTLTYEQFQTIAHESQANFTDLSEGKYVSKNKYDTDIKAKTDEIDTLNGTINTRDTDLADLQKKLTDAGADTDALAKLNGEFTTLKNKYDDDMKNYKAQLKKQAYEFAVKEFANSKKFTSNAAKRDFISSMIAKDLKMENNAITGADDFVNAYTQENADAFVVEAPAPEPSNKPTFVATSQGAEPPEDTTGGFASAFHFTGVRPQVNK